MFFRCPTFLARSLLSLFLLVAVSSQAQSPVRVSVAGVVEAPMNQLLSLSGTLRSPQHTALSAQVDGYVTGIRVQPGDHLEQGQVLLTLDDELPRLEQQRLQAALAEAEALLSDQKRRTREARNLMDENNFSRSEFETLQAEAVAAEARVVQIRAEAKMQDTRVGRHTVKSPFTGVVVEKLVEVGQRISGTTPLLEIARMDPIWADVRVPEQYLGRVHEDSVMHLQSHADGADWIRATVTRTVPVSVGGSRTFLVRAELANSDWQLAPGMSIKVQLTLDSEDERPVLQVPIDAVVRRPGGETRLWVLGEGSPATVSARAVTLGRRSGDRIEVLGGELRAGERVVVRGNENLTEGQKVVPSPDLGVAGR